MPRLILDTTQSTSTSTSTSTTSSSDVSPSILITVLILSIAVILFASLYILLRFLRRKHTSSVVVLPHSNSSSSSTSSFAVSPIIDSLPLFAYDRLTASKNAAGDCAVCLSKFDKHDLLRLLPLCCHAFHKECIDTWLTTSLTCPLCRSTVLCPEKDPLPECQRSGSGSFRVEIGNVSDRHRGNGDVSGEIRRSYSLSEEFDYVIAAEEAAVADVMPGSFRRAMSSELGKEVGRGGGGWLKDFLLSSVSSSRTASFRGSGRFFTGRSMRREAELGEFDEAGRLGDEIGELFRWLSGV